MAPKYKAYKKISIFIAAIAGAFFIAFIAIPHLLAVSYETKVSKSEAEAEVVQAPVLPQGATTTPALSAITHIPTPKQVKAIYMSACVASTPSLEGRLAGLIDSTELNAVVIDVKDFSGTISFPTSNPKLTEVKGPGCTVKDMQALIANLHKKNIYVIARITTFQDPYYTKIHPELAIKKKTGEGLWIDTKGLSYIDVGATPFWDYIVALAKESYSIGFDEINFDYIRYPADGAISNADFTWSVDKGQTKSEALEKFWAYLDTNLHADNIPISADLFGMTTTANNDMGIGQVLENALKHFDFVAPMVYPSHYPTGFNGWSDVNSPSVVGPLIKYVMTSAVTRDKSLALEIASSTSSTTVASGLHSMRVTPSQLRPWLQDENYPVTYTPDMVRAQIQGEYDAGLNSWMLWDANNRYTPSALLQE